MLALWNQVVAYLQTKVDERGAGMVEYALLVVLIALIAFLAIRFAGTQVSQVFSNIGNSLTAAAN